LPANGVILSAGHVFSTTQASQIATSVAPFFTAINGGSVSGSVQVWSPTRGVMTDVIQCTVDQKPDIQRRRANKQSTGTTFAANVTPRP
jgi:hypothetical protein